MCAGVYLKQDTLEKLITHLLNLVLLLFFLILYCGPFFLRINFEIVDSFDTRQDSVDGLRPSQRYGILLTY